MHQCINIDTLPPSHCHWLLRTSGIPTMCCIDIMTSQHNASTCCARDLPLGSADSLQLPDTLFYMPRLHNDLQGLTLSLQPSMIPDLDTLWTCMPAMMLDCGAGLIIPFTLQQDSQHIP